ncbi:hypothetical protein LOTGIDRAFT_230320 [Lottia gigantea]|uniref:Hcy-binding domain-containing protein n=1 Tax=Lottia gigantea TaxID=225164 RepID=V4BE84_LOTGI|nr:hypothetical protein LOTGIDRAFT_230320 [Lottia gigantea]ESP04077.1 hypothetical protein LOTGIDRAFT_230320 [Lottia gigantea]
MPTKGLMQRFADKETVLVAEGYLFEFERRGYLKAGSFVPEVVIEFPNRVKDLHEEFVHAGSDVVQAFTYYGHREKMRLIGKEHLLERLNVDALKIAREVADATGTLMAGNICNTTLYDKSKPETIEQTEKIFKEQIEWAVQYGADFIIGETYLDFGEAELALNCMKKYGQGLPAVVNLAPPAIDSTCDGVPYDVACKKLEDLGADVVGLNCSRGPATMMPIMRKIRKTCSGPIAALPVTYRTTPEHPMMQSLIDPDTNLMAFPENLPAFACSRYQIRDFAKECKEIGVEMVGLCCGNASHYMREVAEIFGRKPPASKYSTDMSLHYMYGSKAHFSKHYTNDYKKMYQSKTE